MGNVHAVGWGVGGWSAQEEQGASSAGAESRGDWSAQKEQGVNTRGRAEMGNVHAVIWGVGGWSAQEWQGVSPTCTCCDKAWPGSVGY